MCDCADRVHKGIACSSDGCHCHDSELQIAFDKEMETDRQARAYGFEVGRGHPLTVQIEKISDDNPFRNVNWRDNVKEAIKPKDKPWFIVIERWNMQAEEILPYVIGPYPSRDVAQTQANHESNSIYSLLTDKEYQAVECYYTQSPPEKALGIVPPEEDLKEN